MRVLPVNICAIFFITMCNFEGLKSSGQMMPRSGMPVIVRKDDDEDLGMLLAVLLLAAKNRNCGCCNCCRCPNTIPVPYPVPVPTGPPVINIKIQKDLVNEDDDEETGDDENQNATDGETPKGSPGFFGP